MANILKWGQAGQYAPENEIAATQRLKGEVTKLAPLAVTYHIQQPTQPVKYMERYQPQGSNISKFFNYFGALSSEIGHTVAHATSWLAHTAVDMVESPFKFANAGYHFTNDAVNSFEQGHQSDRLANLSRDLNNQWKQGKITAEQYKMGLKDIAKEQSDLSRRVSDTTQRMKLTQGTLIKTGIDTAATIITIATAGFAAPEITAGEKLASVWLLGRAAEAPLLKGAQAIAKLADSAAFHDLSPAVQTALQRATAEVLANTPIRMSAGQVSRAAAVNLALKYPLYYWWISGTGQQLYKELDNAKYGDAIRTLAFNAALLLSGGPIGWALKYGGKAVKGAGARTFGQSSFWDELSKFYGDGLPSGFYQSALKIGNSITDKTEKELFFKNLSAVEQTNLNAVGGDAIAAARRVAYGMHDTYGFDLATVTHEEALNDMVKFAKWQRTASEVAKANKLGVVTVGRVDARDLNKISAELSKIEVPEDRLLAWNKLKEANPNQAWANNANFDKQMMGLIGRDLNATEFDNAVRSIKAQFSVKGFPKAIAKQMAKDGYFPIKPVSLEAPFTEGTGKLATRFGEDKFWLKTVQPFPVMSWVGSAISKLGLSTQGTVQRVYEEFNNYLAKNLEEVGVLPKIAGETSGQSADTMIKTLTNYMHAPTRGKVMSKLPLTDYRMLTSADIKQALGVTSSDALKIQKSIARAYVQVPLSIRGLGDRAVDLLYRFGPAAFTSRRYFRIQGALRFAWNPFFQYLRVIPKTEFLSTAEGGGYFRSMFAGRLKQVSEIRTGLRDAGMLEKPGFGITGEAVEFSGVTGKNLTKKLLPMQERSIAGIIDAQAQRMGMDWQTYIKTFPQETRDTIQMIAEYDKRSGFLNSPLARTMNIAIFPFRFESKVLIIMTRNLAKTSLLTQVSFVKGLLGMHDWLNSAEGRAWYATNSEAIGLFKYITPIASLAETFMSLVPGHDHSLGNFGELGGLPFGWIPQVLDSEGLTQFNQPGVNPKTGEAYTQYIPETMRGQIATALQDLLSTVFSYPGATIGLPSKTSLTRAATEGITGASSEDYRKEKPVLNSEQSAYQQAISAGGTAPIPTTPGQPIPPVSVPGLPTSITKPVIKQSKGRKARAKKKSEYRPYLLPGQSKLGQLP